jgi:hypothetical protein
MDHLIGSIIQGLRWPEPIKVDLVDDLGEYILIAGTTVNTRIHIDQMLTKSELEQVKGGEIKAQFNANPRHFFLALATHRYRFAPLYDPLLAMNTSKVDSTVSDRSGVWTCAETAAHRTRRAGSGLAPRTGLADDQYVG